jgi:NAD(P)-dependent dehydrogenase (short-subunit alcohol dehydrogenase family)
MNRSGRRPGPGSLNGLRGLLTGGSSGIGAATARSLAARGVNLAIGGRDLAALRLVAADTGAVCVPGDLREPGCARRSVQAAVDALGGLDLVVSNAGIGWAGPFASMGEPDIDALLDVNLRAAAHVAHAAIPFLEPGVGRLVFVGSIAGLVGVPGEAWYSATKAVSPQTAADAIVDAVDCGRDDVVIPSWLSFPARLKANFPGLYRVLATRFAPGAAP